MRELLRRRAAGAVLVAVTVSSCGTTLVHNGAVTTPAATQQIGAGLLATVGSRTPNATGASSPAALFVLTLADEYGQHPQDIPVEVKLGATTRTMTTDVEGQILLYSPGRVQGARRAGVSPDRSRARRRIRHGRRRHGRDQTRRAAGPVDASLRPVRAGDEQRRRRLARGTPDDVRYTVIDHCNDSKARNAAFPTYAFVVGRGMTLVGHSSLVADQNGYAAVSLRCEAAGPASLVVKDTRNAGDSLDLVGATVSFGGRPSCAKG